MVGTFVTFGDCLGFFFSVSLSRGFAIATISWNLKMFIYCRNLTAPIQHLIVERGALETCRWRYPVSLKSFHHAETTAYFFRAKNGNTADVRVWSFYLISKSLNGSKNVGMFTTEEHCQSKSPTEKNVMTTKQNIYFKFDPCVAKWFDCNVITTKNVTRKEKKSKASGKIMSIV